MSVFKNEGWAVLELNPRHAGHGETLTAAVIKNNYDLAFAPIRSSGEAARTETETE